MWEDMEEVAVVGDSTSGELSTSLRVLGERMETGWEHRTLCKERSRVGMPFTKGTFPLCLILRPQPSGLLSHSSWEEIRGHGPEWNPLDLRQGPLQNQTPCRPIFLPSGFYI